MCRHRWRIFCAIVEPFAVSHESRRLIERDMQLLRRLVAEHQPVIAASQTADPGLIEREALATMLHSFYTGIEGIMRTLCIALDEDVT